SWSAWGRCCWSWRRCDAARQRWRGGGGAAILTAGHRKVQEVMSAQVTLTLPDDILRRAETLAHRVRRPVEDVLAETIALSLKPLGAGAGGERPAAEWSDEDVLTAADATLAAADDRRLRELLGRQQAGALTASEQSDLTALMQRYQDGLLRKARALREA